MIECKYTTMDQRSGGKNVEYQNTNEHGTDDS